MIENREKAEKIVEDLTPKGKQFTKKAIIICAIMDPIIIAIILFMLNFLKGDDSAVPLIAVILVWGALLSALLLRAIGKIYDMNGIRAFKKMMNLKEFVNASSAFEIVEQRREMGKMNDKKYEEEEALFQLAIDNILQYSDETEE